MKKTIAKVLAAGLMVSVTLSGGQAAFADSTEAGSASSGDAGTENSIHTS